MLDEKTSHWRLAMNRSHGQSSLEKETDPMNGRRCFFEIFPSRFEVLLRPLRRLRAAAGGRIWPTLLLAAAFSASAFGAPQPPYFSQEAKEARRMAVDAREQPFLVDVGSRLILPQRGAPVDFSAGFAEVYVQFERPLRANERGRVTRMGVRIHAAVASHTYLASVRPQALQGLQNHPLFRGIEAVEPQDKLTRALYTRDLGGHVSNEDGTLSVHVRFYDDVNLGQALRLLDQHQVEVPNRGRMLFNNRLLTRIRGERLIELASSPSVRSLSEIPPPPMDHNLTAAQLSNVDVVRNAPFNLDGQGVTLGMWESGNPQDTHPALSGRISREEGNITLHGTHVAGTILSSGGIIGGVDFSSTLGMAPAAGTLHSYTSGGDPATEQADAVDDYGIAIANHSWGTTVGWNFNPNADPQWTDTGNTGLFGQYNSVARDWDALVIAKQLVVVKSAGNDGNDCDPDDSTVCDGFPGGDGFQYNTIATHGNAKNIITVGAVEDDGTTLTNFSSAGPTNDLRLKPDVVANGRGLISTCPTADQGVADPDNPDICSSSGTSMSAPTVTGATALLVRRYRDLFEDATPTPDIVKALLVNTAIDLGRPGPDYLYGHGLVDALAAVNTIDVGAVRILTDTADQDDVNEYLVEVRAGTPELRVTLAWTDPEGPVDGSATLVNDLDLRVVGPAGVAFFPFSGPTASFTGLATATGPNRVDNVEHLRVANPPQGFYRVIVRGFAVPDGPQNYALVADASFDLPDQPNIRVNAALDFDELCPGEFQDKVVSIFNIGGGDLVVHSVSVVEGAPDFTVLPNPTQPFIVRPGAHVDVTVRFATGTPGPKEGVLRIVSNDPDEGVLDFDMTGEGGEADLETIVPDDGDFGDVCLGAFADLNLTIVNTGTCDLVVWGIDNSNPAAFQLPGVMSWPITVPPGHSVQIPIRFQPAAPGDYETTLTIISNVGDRTVTFRGSAPESAVTVSEDLAFPATVIQSVGACVSEQPFVVANAGVCPARIESLLVTANGEEFGFSGLPGLPLALLPGEQLGDGGLSALFAPQTLARHTFGTVELTWVDNPVTGTTATFSRDFCGEAVRTGARVLVTHNGEPLDSVERIRLNRINANRQGQGGNVDTLDNSRNLALVTVDENLPCPAIQYHREYGTVSNPIQLLPGSYEVVVQARIDGKMTSKTVGFDVSTCDFNPNIVVDF
jgi:hypothetical protein